jgi:hypothetical protein
MVDPLVVDLLAAALPVVVHSEAVTQDHWVRLSDPLAVFRVASQVSLAASPADHLADLLAVPLVRRSTRLAPRTRLVPVNRTSSTSHGLCLVTDKDLRSS